MNHLHAQYLRERQRAFTSLHEVRKLSRSRGVASDDLDRDLRNVRRLIENLPFDQASLRPASDEDTLARWPETERVYEDIRITRIFRDSFPEDHVFHALFEELLDQKMSALRARVMDLHRRIVGSG
jgi:hypothetical protein